MGTFFFSWLLKILKFLCNCFHKYVIILPKFFKFLTLFATGCWKLKLFLCWFIEIRDLLREHAIISPKIGKICFFIWFVFIIFLRIILWVIYFIKMQIFRGNHQNPCFFKIGSWITGFTAVSFQYLNCFHGRFSKYASF